MIFKYLKKDGGFSIGLILANGLTSVTKGVSFKANAVSQAMDVMGGGPNAHAGFHRIFGGHSIVDFSSWNRFGHDYGIELFKDSLTKNGLPLPGIETLAKKKIVATSVAQKWGTLSFGPAVALLLGTIDTYRTVSRIANDDELDNLSVGIRAAGKIVVGSFAGNLPLVALGGIDCGALAYAGLKKSIQIDLDRPFRFEEQVWL